MSKTISLFSALLCTLIWGTTFIAQDTGMDDIGPFTFNSVRFFVGFLTVAPLAFFFERKKIYKNLKKGRKFFFILASLIGISLFLGSNLHSVVYPINKNKQFNFVSILRKNLNDRELFNYKLFENNDFISSTLTEISKQLDSHIVKNLKDIKCFPVFVSSEIYRPINKKIFFIGDAFFTFPPTFAQGASQSIEVAYELYKNLGDEFDQFNNKRIKKTKMIDRKSKFNYFAFHLNNPLLNFLRNLLIKCLVKNERFIYHYLGKIYKD